MSTQQERANLFVFNNAESLYGHTQDFITTFIAGEASGERITLERLAAKSAEGLDDVWQKIEPGTTHIGKFYAEKFWQAGRAPLLAKIVELEKKCRAADEVIEFYARPLNYNLGSSVLGCERPVKDTSEATWVDPDSDLEYAGVVGGKRARAHFEKYKESEK